MNKSKSTPRRQKGKSIVNVKNLKLSSDSPISEFNLNYSSDDSEFQQLISSSKKHKRNTSYIQEEFKASTSDSITSFISTVPQNDYVSQKDSLTANTSNLEDVIPIYPKEDGKGNHHKIPTNKCSNEFRTIFLSPSSDVISLLEIMSLKAKTPEASGSNYKKEEEKINKPNILPVSKAFNPLLTDEQIFENNTKDHCADTLEIHWKEDVLDMIASNEKQTSTNILQGVIAYVEVRSGHENRSKAIEHQLIQMGAKIFPRFVSTITHVVFREGRKSTRDKAVARGIHLVSVLWVESCKQQGYRVPESEYPAHVPKSYDSPLFLRRVKKLRSMQPKDFNEEFAGSMKKLQKIFNRIRSDNEPCTTSGSNAAFAGNEFMSCKGKNVIRNNEDCIPGSHETSFVKCKLFNSTNKELNSTAKKKIEKYGCPNEYKEIENQNTPKRKRKLFCEINDFPKIVTAPEMDRLNYGVTQQNQLKSLSSPCKETNEEKNLKTPSNKLLVDLPFTAKPRLSLDDFVLKKHKKILKKENIPEVIKEDSFENDFAELHSPNESMVVNQVKCRTLVFTSLQLQDQEILNSIIQSLGEFEVIENVNKYTTHVICGDKRRTLNVLFGLVRGCWLLSPEWVRNQKKWKLRLYFQIYKSMEAGRWLEEELYEVDYFPAIKVQCLQRAEKGSNRQQNLFGKLGNIFVSIQSTPAHDKLTELIKLAGGEVNSCFRKCQIAIGPLKYSNRESNLGVIHLTEKWVLDCISQHDVLPFTGYKYELLTS